VSISLIAIPVIGPFLNLMIDSSLSEKKEVIEKFEEVIVREDKMKIARNKAIEMWFFQMIEKGEDPAKINKFLKDKDYLNKP